MNRRRYIIRTRETGDIIESYNTTEQAKKRILEFEDLDKKDKVYVPHFYEIYDSALEAILEI